MQQHLKKGLYYCLVVSATLFGDNPTTKTSISFIDKNATATITKHYTPSSGESNISRFNTKDWEGHFAKQGLFSTSVIGNNNALFSNKEEGKLAASGDMSALTTDSLKKNGALSGNKSIGAFTSSLQSAVVNNVANSIYGGTTKAKNIKCYITRDIGTSFMCTAPNNNLTVSSGMGGRESLAKIKASCEGQCFTQSTCINMQQNETTKVVPMPTLDINLTSSAPSKTFAYTIDPSLTIDYIEFNETVKSYGVKYTITYTDWHDKSQTLVENLLSLQGSYDTRRLYIGDIAKSLTMTITMTSPLAQSANIQLSNISMKYKSNAQYICPSIQDVTNDTPGEFANKCSYGRSTILNRIQGSVVKSYTICANAVYPGQNQDGTFYQQNACESICRKQYSCIELAGSENAVNSTGLKGFREGCIENASASCNNLNNDCAMARTNPQAKIINEIVFDGEGKPLDTVVNGTIPTNTQRPRLSLLSLSSSGTDGNNAALYAPNDNEFELQKLEEWKDKAYDDMMANAHYNNALYPIGKNTLVNNAYGINLKSGSFYGYTGTSTRSLIWKLKPAAFDVGVGGQFGLYSVIKLIVQNYRYDSGGYGVKRPFYDEIWFLKGSSSNQFTPFYYVEDAYELLANNTAYGIILPSYSPKANAQGQFLTFIGGLWQSLSPSQTVPYFLTENFASSKAFWEYEILENMEAKYDIFPGLIHSVTFATNQQETLSYTGKIDPSTASTILKMIVHVGYQPLSSPFSYETLKSKITNGEIPILYETGNENSYPRFFRGDGEKDNNIVLYMYGQSHNGSAFFTIRPRKDHIGKKGFIYVYGQ